MVAAVELLQREKSRIGSELERDYEKLRVLEGSARAQARERREQLRKAHVLAPTKRARSQDRVESRRGQCATKILDDPTLQPLSLQLAGHVESMRGNLQQTEGIAPAVARGRAALQDVLLRHLDRGAYEQVVLG
ncbi:hypothetical protein G7046_g10171 [Stylonectria norvegica]|nr:hypothetical protein G7046_g10171 [Stylonectria norvegica]